MDFVHSSPREALSCAALMSQEDGTVAVAMRFPSYLQVVACIGRHACVEYIRELCYCFLSDTISTPSLFVFLGRCQPCS